MNVQDPHNFYSAVDLRAFYYSSIIIILPIYVFTTSALYIKNVCYLLIRGVRLLLLPALRLLSRGCTAYIERGLASKL